MSLMRSLLFNGGVTEEEVIVVSILEFYDSTILSTILS